MTLPIQRIAPVTERIWQDEDGEADDELLFDADCCDTGREHISSQVLFGANPDLEGRPAGRYWSIDCDQLISFCPWCGARLPDLPQEPNEQLMAQRGGR